MKEQFMDKNEAQDPVINSITQNNKEMKTLLLDIKG